MSNTKENTIESLDKVMDIIRQANKVKECKIYLVNEMAEVPAKYWMERRPTGWVDVDIHIRLHGDVT